MVAYLTIFALWTLGISFKIPVLGSQIHTVHEVNSDKKLASKCLRDAQRGSENENAETNQRSRTKIEGHCIDVGTGGIGGTCPLDFAINKKCPLYFQKVPPFS